MPTNDEKRNDECRHYWLIEAANGPRSLGTCNYCGKERYFFNSFPDPSQLKQGTNPMGLPVMKHVEIDKKSQS